MIKFNVLQNKLLSEFYNWRTQSKQTSDSDRSDISLISSPQHLVFILRIFSFVLMHKFHLHQYWYDWLVSSDVLIKMPSLYIAFVLFACPVSIISKQHLDHYVRWIFCSLRRMKMIDSHFMVKSCSFSWINCCVMQSIIRRASYCRSVTDHMPIIWHYWQKQA